LSSKPDNDDKYRHWSDNLYQIQTAPDDRRSPANKERKKKVFMRLINDPTDWVPSGVCYAPCGLEELQHAREKGE
jgi:hypothetical protein